MSDDSISRQAATQTALNFIVEYLGGAFDEDFQLELIERMNDLPSAEPEASRIEQELHGKTPEEQYDFIYWLLFKSFEATAFSNSRLAIIDWLKGDRGNE